MQEAIKRAAEKGYLPSPAVKFCGSNNDNNGWSVWEMESGSSFCQPHSTTLLDPEFWECLGKTEEWGSDDIEYPTPEEDYVPTWRYHWHKLIDHLAEGKDINSFFDNLLK